MGRVNTMNAPNPTLKHFSHPHELELVNLQNHNPIPSICSACKLEESGEMYICRPCNFSLHLSCAHFPGLIDHPCHPDHPLALLPSSSYPGGLFNCDACNRRGDGFNYHCLHCDFDLHVFCASKPLEIAHRMHPCPLKLTFTNPYHDVKGFACDVCKKIGSKQWLYRCSVCEFDVHLDCSNAAPKSRVQPPPLLPPVSQQQLFMGSTSHAQFQQAPMPIGLNHLQQSADSGAILYNQFVQTPAIANKNVGNGLLNAAIHGLVEGAAQQVGQTIVESFLGHESDESANAYQL